LQQVPRLKESRPSPAPGIRNLALDLALLFLALFVLFNTDPHAVFRAFQSALATVFGL
jgi:hypothetical protein